MKRWKIWQISLFVVFCILINFGGSMLASKLGLPLWLDAYGTVLCAYAGGPLCGMIVGLATNLVCGMENGGTYLYALTSVAIALLVGFLARRKHLDSMFDTMTIGALTAFVALAISVPLNMVLYDGSTGSVWGDGVIGFLRERGLPLFPCQIIGQFYVEFLDKLITLVLLYLTVRLVRFVRRRGQPKHAAEEAITAAVVVALALGVALTGPAARAEGRESVDYNNFVQTVYDSSTGLPAAKPTTSPRPTTAYSGSAPMPACTATTGANSHGWTTMNPCAT
jgi:energy-coupling factor transport system substrate-specific component